MSSHHIGQEDFEARPTLRCLLLMVDNCCEHKVAVTYYFTTWSFRSNRIVGCQLKHTLLNVKQTLVCFTYIKEATIYDNVGDVVWDDVTSASSPTIGYFTRLHDNITKSCWIFYKKMIVFSIYLYLWLWIIYLFTHQWSDKKVDLSHRILSPHNINVFDHLKIFHFHH